MLMQASNNFSVHEVYRGGGGESLLTVTWLIFQNLLTFFFWLTNDFAHQCRFLGLFSLGKVWMKTMNVYIDVISDFAFFVFERT